jgi:PAS domain S-box-containing protein
MRQRTTRTKTTIWRVCRPRRLGTVRVHESWRGAYQLALCAPVVASSLLRGLATIRRFRLPAAGYWGPHMTSQGEPATRTTPHGDATVPVPKIAAGGDPGAGPLSHAEHGGRAVEKRDLLTLLVGSVSDYAIFALDVDGNVTTWNIGAERLKGYRAEEIIGRHFSAFYPPADLAAGKPERHLAIAVADGHFEDEGWRLRNDGSTFWANVVITALRGDDGRLVGFGKVTRDLTDRRRAEELLRQSEERFRLLVSSVSDYAIFLLDPDGIISSWNLGAERLKGYRADEIVGTSFSRFYTSDDMRDDVPGRALRTAFSEGRVETEGWRLRKDGSRFWANVVITSLWDAGGVHRGFAKVTQDLTDRKRNEDALRGVLARERDVAAQLREVDRMRSHVLGLVAHDLRAPLGVIEGLVHRLRTDWPALPDVDKLDYLHRIVTRTVAMGALVDDVAEMAHIDTGHLDIQCREFSVQSVVQDAIEDAVGQSERLVTTDIEPGLQATGDARRTWQVLVNLLSNALKFSPEGAAIHVAAGKSDHVHVSVIDSGPGIALADQQRVFERFVRLAGSNNIPGSGMGLYIAKSLIEAQHGQISVESSPGGGATFRFTLPAAS